MIHGIEAKRINQYLTCKKRAKLKHQKKKKDLTIWIIN